MKQRIARTLAVSTAVVLGLTALAGCAPGSSSTTSTAAAVTDPTKIKPTTITVLDTWISNDLPLSRWIRGVEKDFQAKYPQIKVKRETETFDDINKTLSLRLSDPSTPDVVPVNQGWIGLGTLGPSGLIANLDGYSTAYGWDKRIPKSILRYHRATPNGKNIGGGSLYGVPSNNGQFIGVYYNRAKLSALGLSVPTTFHEFENDLARVKSAGETPLSLGTLNGDVTPLFALHDALGDPAHVQDYVYGNKSVALKDTGMTQAAQKYQQWAQAGYFPKGFEGLSQDDASAKYVAGNSVFYFWYSDSLPFPDQATADKFGVFLLPRNDKKPDAGTMSSTQNFSISEKSRSKDAAALFLDYVSSKQAGDIAIKSGIAPLLGPFKADTSSSLLNDELKVLNLLTASGNFIPYEDSATPTTLDTANQQVQLLLSNKTTPDGLVTALQAEYDKFYASKG